MVEYTHHESRSCFYYHSRVQLSIVAKSDISSLEYFSLEKNTYIDVAEVLLLDPRVGKQSVHKSEVHSNTLKNLVV